jgi:hypothetical protein
MLRALLALSLAGAATVEQLSVPGIAAFLPAGYGLAWSAVLLLSLAGIAAIVARSVVVARRRAVVADARARLLGSH